MRGSTSHLSWIAEFVLDARIMDTLPQDLIDDIVSYLLPSGFKPKEPLDERKKPSPPLAPLATVSRRLQVAVERLTFRYIEISSEGLGRFEDIFTFSRRRFLKSLIFTAILPSYDDAARLRAESPADRAANDASYSQAVQALFRILNSWETEDPKGTDSHMTLVIKHPESPSDLSWPSDLAPWWGVGGPTERCCIHEGRYLHSYIDFLHADELPTLQGVKKLVMLEPGERYGYRNVRPIVPFLLASRMPNLESIELTADDNEKRFPDVRKRNRDEMAQFIRSLSLPNLRHARLKFYHRNYRNEKATPPALHEPGSDPLSLALCQLSLRLVDLVVTGIFDESILRPLQGLSEATWPNLRYLHIEIQATTPSGGWYFTASHEQDAPAARSFPAPKYTVSTLHEEEFSFLREAQYAHLIPVDTFRNKVNEETLTPFIETFADALSVMPKLRSAALNCQLVATSDEDGELAWFNVAFIAPCSSAKKYPPKLICPGCARGVTRQLVTNYMGWVPSDGLAAKLRGIHDSFSGEPMIEKDVAEYLREQDD